MMQHNPGFLKLVEQIQKDIKEIEPSQVANWLKDAKFFHLIDCRETEEWQAGHIHQAQHLSRGILERDIETCIPDMNHTVVIYCGGGYRSALAVANMQQMGYRNVISMAGGFRRWQEEGREIDAPKTPLQNPSVES